MSARDVESAQAGSAAAGAEERIISATIEIIERDGMGRATTRAIAALAGVNIASINYYFRSKEALVNTALTASWDNARADLLALIETGNGDPAGTLQAFTLFLLEGQTRYPKVTQAHLSETSARRPAVVSDFRDLVERLAAKVGTDLGRTVGAGDLSRTWALVAAVMLPAFVPGLSPDLSTAQARAAYIRLLTADFLEAFGR